MPYATQPDAGRRTHRRGACASGDRLWVRQKDRARRTDPVPHWKCRGVFLTVARSVNHLRSTCQTFQQWRERHDPRPCGGKRVVESVGGRSGTRSGARSQAAGSARRRGTAALFTGSGTIRRPAPLLARSISASTHSGLIVG